MNYEQSIIEEKNTIEYTNRIIERFIENDQEIRINLKFYNYQVNCGLSGGNKIYLHNNSKISNYEGIKVMDICMIR